MDAPCVTGGTYYGGTALLLLCPRQFEGEPCEAELDAEFDFGHLAIKVKACGWCKAEWTDEDKAALEKQAKEAIDNYDGPSDRELESMMSAPSMAERTELANRDYMRLKR